MSPTYRCGLPREADLVIDARFLKNPHYEATLKPLDRPQPGGRAVRFIASDPGYRPLHRSLAQGSDRHPLLSADLDAEGKSQHLDHSPIG